MFSPDVWSFDPPNTLITHKYGKLNEKNQKEICKRFHCHPFNKLITIVVPDTKVVPDSILPLLTDTDHYIVKNLSVTELIRKPFIEGFIKRGQFYGLSVDTRIDVDDCIGITPSGLLYLSVTKDIYHYLGLEGKLSSFATKHPNRYSIEIDLKSKELATTTKYYTRVQTALSNELLPTFSLRILWNPPVITSTAHTIDDAAATNQICPSSIAKYFSDLGYEVDLSQTDFKLHNEYALQMPRLGPDTDEPIEIDGKTAFYATPHELVEYMGMLTMSCNLDASEYINSWSFTGHSIEVGSALVIRVKGMFSSELIKALLRKLREYAANHSNIPWVSLYVHGFPHAPLSFGHKEHSFGSNGDNSYVLFLTPDSKYMQYEFLSSNKALK